MPRVLVVGNGNMLVNFDHDMNIRDLYYPHVGMENHVEGHKCRIGIWANGNFAWSKDFKKNQLKYKKEAMATDVVMTHESLGIELEICDTVHHLKNVFLRKAVIRNPGESGQEVRIFFTHDIHIYGQGIGDTAFYHPDIDAVVHYKKKRYFLANGITPDGGGIYQYSTGNAEFKELEGTFKDAEDGLLSNNPIAHGSVDSTISLKVHLEPGEEKDVYYWIAAGRTLDEVAELNEFVKSKTPLNLINSTITYHSSWVNKLKMNFAGLPQEIVDMFKRSLLILRTQIDDNGAILAANDSDILQFNQDYYSYMWPRDGALVATGLDRAGYTEVTKRFFTFCKDAITKDGYLLHKYNTDGSPASSWHAYIDPDGIPQLPIQEDETALVLFALWEHYDRFRDIEFVQELYEPLVVNAADFLARYRYPETGLPKPSYDLWEERRGVFTFTSSAVYAGLMAASNFARIFGDKENEKKYKRAADETKDAILTHLFDSEENRFLRMVSIDGGGNISRDRTLDSSVYGIFEFGVLAPDDERVANTMREIEERLWVKTGVGGLARYENDYYHQVSKDIERIPGNPWFICTLWLAEWYIGIAKNKDDLNRAVEILNWAVEHTIESGIMAEQINPITNEPISVSPLTWSHSSFVIAVIGYLEKLKEINICTVCGAPKLVHLHENKKLVIS